MTGDGLNTNDNDDLAEVGRALGYDEERQPPSDRVEAVRNAARQLRDERSALPHPTAPRRRRSLFVGAAAAGLGLVAGAVGRDLFVGNNPTPAPVVATEALTLTGVPAGVSAVARLINHTWGTEVLLDVRDLPPGQAYRVDLQTTTGVVGAGSFLSVADVLMVCRFNAAPLRADVRAVVVRDPSDRQVMRADLA